MLQHCLHAKPHKCKTKLSMHNKCRFCAHCGSYMTKSVREAKFYRSKKYYDPNLYVIDHVVELEELIAKQSWNRFYNSKNLYISYRKNMIIFVEEIAERLEYRESTLHLAVALFDAFMALSIVDIQMLKLIGFMALYLAAKLQENNQKIPELSCISKLFDNSYTVTELEDLEIMFMKTLEYNLNLKTPYSFIEYFFSVGVVSDRDLKCISLDSIDGKITLYETIVVHFIRIALEKYDFYQYTSIAIATSSMACARKLMCFKETWPKELEILTKVTWKAISTCTEILFNIAKEDYPFIFENNKSSLRTEESDQIEHLTKLRSDSLITMDCESEKESTTHNIENNIERYSDDQIQEKPSFLFSCNNFN